MTATPPILLNKQYAEPTVFTAENLLREARRQKSLTRMHVPPICVLDPDGDIVRWPALKVISRRGLTGEVGMHCKWWLSQRAHGRGIKPHERMCPNHPTIQQEERSADKRVRRRGGSKGKPDRLLRRLVRRAGPRSRSNRHSRYGCAGTRLRESQSAPRSPVPARCPARLLPQSSYPLNRKLGATGGGGET